MKMEKTTIMKSMKNVNKKREGKEKRKTKQREKIKMNNKRKERGMINARIGEE